MSEINDILNLNEEILWKRIQVKNLVLTYPVYILIAFITIIIIFCFIYPGILALTYNMIFFGNSMLITGIVFEVLVVFLEVSIFRKFRNRYRKTLIVPNEELKEYKVIDALSNRRVIIKDVRRQSFKKKYVEENSISGIEFNKDYLFLNLKNVEAILFRKSYHQIEFSLNKTENMSLIYFDFHYPKREAGSKMKEVMETLNKNFVLEKYFENKYLIKYHFSLK
jgi:hypothetical protein